MFSSCIDSLDAVNGTFGNTFFVTHPTELFRWFANCKVAGKTDFGWVQDRVPDQYFTVFSTINVVVLLHQLQLFMQQLLISLIPSCTLFHCLAFKYVPPEKSSIFSVLLKKKSGLSSRKYRITKSLLV